MSVIQIRKAQREGARLVIGVCGVSSSGKTHTGLLIALGLTGGDPSKIGFIDTENRRGSLYADVFRKLDGDDAKHRSDEPFLIGDLYPPFSPQRYIDAIQQFQAAGVEVLIIDSATHEWEGTGGCQDIAEAGNPRMPNWNKAKAEHKRFMNAALQCDMHIIFCVRAREKAKPEKDASGKVVYQDMGLQPITEKNFMFEMTVSMMVHDQGTRREILKCPAELRPIFDTTEKYIGVKQGIGLRKWVDGAGVLSPKVEKWRNSLLSNTEKGAAHIESCWQQTPADVREALGEEFHATLKASAAEFDKQRTEAAAEAVGDGSPPLLAPLPTEGAGELPASSGNATPAEAVKPKRAAPKKKEQAEAPPQTEQQEAPPQADTPPATQAVTKADPLDVF